MNKHNMFAFAAVVLVLVIGYGGFMAGHYVGLQESYLATAYHANSKIAVLRDIRGKNVAEAIRKLETAVDVSVMLLMRQKWNFTDYTNKLVQKALGNVNVYRAQYPWGKTVLQMQGALENVETKP